MVLRRQPLLPALTLALVAAAASADEVSVRVVPIDDRVPPCGRTTVQASPDVSAEWPGTLDLDPARVWTVRMTSERCWAADATLVPGAPRALTFVVWPAGTIAGELVTKGDASRSPVTVRASSSRIAETPLACTVEGRRWQCIAPATDLDVRIEAGDFIPHYAWSVAVPAAGRRDLGAIRLERGASVSGWVTVAGDAVEGVSVELVPEALAGDRVAAPARTAKTNRRGFFQIRGVAPASYGVVARHAGWSPARVQGLTIEHPREYAMRDALALQPLAKLELAIEPAADLDGTPWKVRLTRAVPFSWFSETVAEEEATDGRWLRERLEAGRYRLSVADRRGASQYAEEIDVTPDMLPLRVAIERVWIEGRITAGEDPLQAEITFRKPDGANVALRSDADGAFAGALPRDGKWRLDVRPHGVDGRVHGVSVDVKRGERLDVRLPGGRIRGIVVDENGRPVAAGVLLRRDRVGLLGSVKSGEDGTFEIVGIEPGDAVVQARDRTRDSGPLAVAISDTSTELVRLTLRRNATLTGVVLAPNGRPIAGALIRCLSPELGRLLETVSGPAGDFSVAVPAAATRVDAVVLAPGFPIKVVSLPVTADAVAELVVGRGAGLLRIPVERTPPFPQLRRDGGWIGVNFLLFPPDAAAPPRGLVRGGFAFEVEPGEYTVCNAAREACVTRVVQPGTEVSFEGR